MKIALVPPIKKDDYLLNTVIDGLFQVQGDRSDLEFRIVAGYPSPFGAQLHSCTLPQDSFEAYAREADLVIASFLNEYTNIPLLERLAVWEKTVIIDGTEWGKDRRFDFNVQRQTLYDFLGNKDVPDSVLNKAALYFRREKPYIKGIIPFPFGIEARYLAQYDPKKKKDIDFVCIWGQDEHPRLRKYTQEFLEAFCEERNLTCHTKKTKGFDFTLERTAGRDEFYELLSRAKVGISVGGGGYDTVRFWEILANNCLLLTERIDIYHPESAELGYGRIYQFNNLYDFEHQLERVAEFLRTGYREESLQKEYQEILAKHSTKARVLGLLSEAKKKGLVQ